MKKLIALSVTVFLVAILCSSIQAKQIKPAEIMGRNLNYPGLGWLGHVGIATAPMTSPEGLNQNANLVVEILNETPVGQLNPINNFKSRSIYWGSKYGIADNSVRAFNVLAEANHQRWICPSYTFSTSFHIGVSDPKTGAIRECGRWRCDTFAWWAFYSQGWNTMPGCIWIPKVLFNAFPYYNDEMFFIKNKSTINHVNRRTLEDVTAEELNAMPFEEFEMIMDQPAHHPVTKTESAEIRFAYNENLNDIKRGIMIDRLVSKGDEPHLVRKLLTLYNQTQSIDVKDKIIENLMLYNQQQSNQKSYADQSTLKSFFSDVINSKNLTSKSADTALRGFIDTHSPEEIMSSHRRMDALLLSTNHYSSVMLKYSLVHKSKALQRIYIKSIITELREANNSDLDSYLFGPLTIGYEGTGKDLLDSDSKQIVIDYLKEVRYKYIPKENSSDSHASVTAPLYFKLCKAMSI